jgi:predicted nucleotidyltransferase
VVDEATYVLYAAVAEAAEYCDARWMITGAASRVLLLEKIYGLPRGRATEDVDFAVMVESWNHYEVISSRICRDPRFTRDAKQRQRFRYSEGAYLDLVPFGGVESAGHVIVWPPENDFSMSVLGFREAYADVVKVTLNSKLLVLVISPVGLMLLKLIAWRDRHITQPRRDAADIAYVLRYFSTIETEKALFDYHFDALEAADYDIDLAGARVLGRRTRMLASAETHQQLRALLDNELKVGTDSRLVHEIADSLPVDGEERAYQLMDQFRKGLIERINS